MNRYMKGSGQVIRFDVAVSSGKALGLEQTKNKALPTVIHMFDNGSIEASDDWEKNVFVFVSHLKCLYWIP